MQAQITEAVRSAIQGSRKIKITFKRSAAGDVNYLLGMSRGGIIKLSESDELVMTAVAQSGSWDGDANRTLTIDVTDDFEESWFVGRMWRALEKIEVVN